jgi:hypothetical protein
MARSNAYRFREEWLQAALSELRPYFAECGYPLPEKIRAAIGFPSSGRKSSRVGETWHCRSSGDGFYEIFIRPDLAEPLEVLAVLCNKLIHCALPDDVSHGRKFRTASLTVGLSGKMHKAELKPLLRDRLQKLADSLGPLPHDSLNLAHDPMTGRPLDKPKRKGGRLIKAECPECAKGDMPYIIRVAASTLRKLGAPGCPVHGNPMAFELPLEDGSEEAGQVEVVEVEEGSETLERRRIGG